MDFIQEYDSTSYEYLKKNIFLIRLFNFTHQLYEENDFNNYIWLRKAINDKIFSFENHYYWISSNSHYIFILQKAC